MQIKILKMQGCGNDFLFIDAMSGEGPSLVSSEIQFLCDRHFGIGADGLVILKEGLSADASWEFYNCDGSEAGMCGNAARCAIRLLMDRYFADREVVAIETKAGIIKGRKLEGDTVEVTVLPEKNVKLEYQEKIVEVNDEMHQVFCINTGVPHAVIQVESLTGYPVAQVGRNLVHHDMFGDEGTNVTFFQRLVGNQIMSTTFERGVEQETLACGTGAAAAAAVYVERYLESFPIEVSVPGGRLTVDMSPVSCMLLLRGPCQYVFDVEMEEIVTRFERPKLFGETKRG